MEQISEQEAEPIVGWFTVRDIPIGDAPEDIKSDWLDVTIPIRHIQGLEETELIALHGINEHERKIVFNTESTVTVNTADAVLALRLASRNRAADWWLQWSLRALYEYGSGSLLTFMRNEGETMTTEEMDTINPDLSANYDDSDLDSYIKRVMGDS